MKIPSWIITPINELTLEDAMEAAKVDINFICGDGRVQQVKGSLARQVLNILEVRGEQ